MTRLEKFMIEQLSAKHNIDVELLTEVIEGCNYPSIALEVLAGIAEPHKLPTTAKDTTNETNRTLVSVNRVSDKVVYEYRKLTTQYKYNDEWADRNDIYRSLNRECSKKSVDEVIEGLETRIIVSDDVYTTYTNFAHWIR